LSNIVDPYLFPARGRKQWRIDMVYVLNRFALIPTFSPQGDGNVIRNIVFKPLVLVLIPTFSPQGDGNLSLTIRSAPAVWTLIPTFSPQGDGNTRKSGTRRASGIHVDPYLFPARGRKPWLPSHCQFLLVWLIPTFSPQGDGNRLCPSQKATTASALIPTFSPQGDGNLLHTGWVEPSGNTIVDPYLFPARGRKPDCSIDILRTTRC